MKRFDEALLWDPLLRESMSDLARLTDWQRQADRLLVAEGAGHLVHDLPVRADGRAAGIESRPWRLDPIPFVVETSNFQWLAAAVTERMEALERVIADLYGDRTLLRDGIVSSDLVHSSPLYRTSAVGTLPQRWLTTYAVDLVRTADGYWHVVADFTDAPAGLGYALLNRSVMSRVASELHGRSGVASLARFSDLLRRSLAACSAAESPRTVLFTGGIDHPSYVDHSYLAVKLGVTLVEGADLVVRQRRVWLRTLDGVEPVDVIYRRLESPSVDPLEVGAMGSAGVPALLFASRSGGVALANAHGSGVIEDERLVPSWPAAIEHLTGSSLRLPVLPGSGWGSPSSFAVSPLHVDDGIVPGSVVLRMFACHDGRRASVLPGGIGRVMAPGDDPRLPTAAAAKDVWVLGSTLTPLVVRPLPQVDFGRSVPTRAAASLYWMNRSAERSEAIARTIRVVSSRLEEDPGLAGVGGGAWSDRAQALIRRLRRLPDDASDLPGIDALYDELARAGDAVAFEIGSLLTEATSVREFLSVTTGRVLERVSRCRSSLQRHVAEVDDLDSLLTDLAALAGLWNESTVRGPAWRIGDMGRGLERAFVVLDAVEAGMCGVPDASEPTDVDVLVIELLLASNESLVAYRRRYRSEVEPSAAASLLVRDRANPRSLAASLERISRHAAASEWEAGVVLSGAATDALGLDLEELVPTVRGVLEELARAIVARWFAAPVSPVVVSGRQP